MDRHNRDALDRYITGNYGKDSIDDDELSTIVCAADSLAALAAEVRRDKGRKSLADFLDAHVDAWREEVRVMEQQRDHALAEATTLRLKLGEP